MNTLTFQKDSFLLIVYFNDETSKLSYAILGHKCHPENTDFMWKVLPELDTINHLKKVKCLNLNCKLVPDTDYFETCFNLYVFVK